MKPGKSFRVFAQLNSFSAFLPVSWFPAQTFTSAVTLWLFKASRSETTKTFYFPLSLRSMTSFRTFPALRLLALLCCTTALAQAALPADKVEHVRSLLRDRKLAEAETVASALVAAHRADPEAHALLGRVHMAKEDPEVAVKACEKAVELAPTNGELRRQLGDAYGFAAQKAGVLSKMSWAKKCRLAYEKAIELEPSNLNARTSLMTYYQQAPALVGGGMDKAYAQAAEIKRLDPKRGVTAFVTLYIGEKKFTEAATALEEALKAAPDDYAALFQVGRLAALSGERVDRGMEALNKCLSLVPPAGSPGHEAAHWRLGNLWEKKGDKAAARAAYQAALKLNPTFPQAIESLKKLE